MFESKMISDSIISSTQNALKSIKVYYDDAGDHGRIFDGEFDNRPIVYGLKINEKLYGSKLGVKTARIEIGQDEFIWNVTYKNNGESK